MSPDVPPLPAFGGGSLADVLPAVLPGLGVPNGEREPRGTDALAVPQSTRVCVVLVDGLGATALAAHSAQAPFLTAMRGHPSSREITSVFPTTTPIALTSLGAGLAPGEHGITGLFIRLPEDGRLVNTLAIPGEVDMRALQTRPTVFERAARAGVAVTKVGPRTFDGQGLSEAGLRGGEYRAAESVGERVDAAAGAVRRGERALTYVYFGDLDSTGHRRGAASGAWRQELTHIDRVVEQLAGAMPDGSTLLVTSDHGMVDVPFEDRCDVASTPALAEGVEVVAGDMRGVHVHALPGAAGDVLAAWRATLGEDFWVLSREEAVTIGLFGPVVADHVLPRLGDVVAAARGARAVIDSRVLPGSVLGLVGLHGSVTDDELLVPLLVHEQGHG